MIDTLRHEYFDSREVLRVRSLDQIQQDSVENN
jgi:hypothetical protein